MSYYPTDSETRYLKLAGGTLTGALNLAADPTAALQPATKQYTDAAGALKVAKAGDTMTGALVHPAGTAALPSVTFTGDTNTGLYSPGADQVALGTAGTGRFFIDANGRVGVGTASPSTNLDVTGSIATSDGVYSRTTAQTLTICGNPTLVNSVPRIELNGTAAAEPSRVSIRADTTIFTKNSALLESARIDSSGRLGIGTSSPQLKLDVAFNGTFGVGYQPLVNLRNTNYGGNSALPTGLGAINWNIEGNYDVANIEAVRENPNSGTFSSLVFRTNPVNVSTGSGAERMRITSSGGIGFGGGITIGNVSPTSSTAIYIAGTVITSGAGTSTLKYNGSTGLVTYDTSSRLVKEDIADCPYGLDAVKLLQPRKYFRTDDQRDEIGFVADELVNVLPEFVPIGPKSVITKSEDDTDNIPLGVNYEKLTAVLTKALQEAAVKIETLEARLTAAGID
jgi:hypothetical protein